MELFYSTNITDNKIILNKEESNHCINVLRYSIGDEINIVDGVGNMYVGIVSEIINKECFVKIIKTINDFKNKDYYIHVGISPIKNHSRFEWFVEKAVEVGIDEISIINCARTIKKSIRKNRIDRISQIAMKQTIKAKLPSINYDVSFEDFIQNNLQGSKYICHLNKEITKTLFDCSNNFKYKQSSILIGPEGDFTEYEVESALKENFIEISLGHSRLRTETAGVVACNLLNVMYENKER